MNYRTFSETRALIVSVASLIVHTIAACSLLNFGYLYDIYPKRY